MLAFNTNREVPSRLVSRMTTEGWPLLESLIQRFRNVKVKSKDPPNSYRSKDVGTMFTLSHPDSHNFPFRQIYLCQHVLTCIPKRYREGENKKLLKRNTVRFSNFNSILFNPHVLPHEGNIATHGGDLINID